MVESTRLESERTGNRTVGSNPTLSAILKTSLKLVLLTNCYRIPRFNGEASMAAVYARFRGQGGS